MIKVSVIVPVYNKSEYLKECLDSLVNQTLRDIEIICVDDKSTDNSLDILFSYSDKDSRVKVYQHESNMGLSATRNKGMQVASGEYIAFVDADDFVDTDFYEKLYNASCYFDVVKGEIWEYDAQTNRCERSNISQANEKIKETGNPLYFYYGITSAIYKRSIIESNNLCFSEKLFYNEDTVFIFSIVSKVAKVKVVDGVKYYYRFVPGSLSRSFSESMINSLCRSAIMTIDLITQANLSYEDKSIVFDNLFTLVSFFVNSGLLSYEAVCDIKNVYLGCMEKDWKNKQHDFKVSVILPIYNGEEYVRRALFCLTFQTLFDIEIICVNDGSTDSSMNIITEFAKGDDRITIIDCEKNGGQSRARNIGLKAAKGKYIAFLDQDDQVDFLFYKKLYNCAIQNNADIAKGNAIEIDYDGPIHPASVLPVQKNPFYFCNYFFTGIFRRSMLLDNGIVFPEGYSLGEDLKFLFDAVSHANKVSCEWNVYYYYIRHKDSEDPDITSVNKIGSVIHVIKYIINKIEEGDFYNNDLEVYILYYSMYIYHLSERIPKCADEKGKYLCFDLVFELYNLCKTKDAIIDKLQITNPLLAYSLKNNDRAFYEQVMINGNWSNAFYHKETAISSCSVPIQVVATYSNSKLIKQTIIDNAFLLKEGQIKYHIIDNKKSEKGISQAYNSFIKNYDYSKEAWFIFVRDSFEFLSFPSEALSCLDKNKIYGPAGAKAYCTNYKVGIALKGHVYEKDTNNKIYIRNSKRYYSPEVDTLDSMCVIVHSSLIKEFNLRFDDNLSSELFVEDFCLEANNNFRIPIETICFDCVFHSFNPDLKNDKIYCKQLKLLNEKYPDRLFGGTASPIGGKIMPLMNDAEFDMYRIRYEIKNKMKL